MRQLLRVVPIAIAVAFLVPAMTPAVAQAQSVDQQKQKVEDIVDELERLEERALQIGEQYNDAIDTKSQLDVEIADAETRIAEKEAELAQLRANLSEMALRSFVGGGAAPLGPLFEDAANLNDAIQREELAKVALSAGDVTTDELDALVADINDERKALDNKRQQAEQLADSLIDAKAQTEKLTAEYTNARADAEAKLGQLVAQEEARRAQESARRIQEQARSNQAASNSGGGNSGRRLSGAAPHRPRAGRPRPARVRRGPAGASAHRRCRLARASPCRPRLRSRASRTDSPRRVPGVGFDCSGLTAYAWGQSGVGLPHQSAVAVRVDPRVPIDQAQPGDLLFFYSPISHVSIYLGNGMQVHAPNTGSTVSVAAVNWGKVVGVGRPG